MGATGRRAGRALARGALRHARPRPLDRTGRCLHGCTTRSGCDRYPGRIGHRPGRLLWPLDGRADRDVARHPCARALLPHRAGQYRREDRQRGGMEHAHRHRPARRRGRDGRAFGRTLVHARLCRHGRPRAGWPAQRAGRTRSTRLCGQLRGGARRGLPRDCFVDHGAGAGHRRQPRPIDHRAGGPRAGRCDSRRAFYRIACRAYLQLRAAGPLHCRTDRFRARPPARDRRPRAL
ncbi:hypothetical protein D3C81_1240170 [compost metagenome]